MRSVNSWDCSVPNPPPPYKEVGRSRKRWEGPEGEDSVVHLRRLSWETKELREKQRWHELGEEDIEDNISTFDSMDMT
jgi:hypothetical protein